MSVDFTIRQKRLLKKSFDLGLVEDLCRQEGLRYGISNPALVLDPYKGGRDIAETYLVLYDPERIGRGFSIQLQKNRHDIALNLNIPCTADDVRLCYRIAEILCHQLGAKELDQDGARYPLSEIPVYMDHILSWNQDMLKEFAKKMEEDGPMMVFGAVYPVHLQEHVCAEIRGLPKEKAVEAYANYLDERQKGDYYYAKATVYQVSEEYVGVYFLTQDVLSIVPLQPELPVLHGTGLERSDIHRWEVHFGALQGDGGDFQNLGSLPFDVFADRARLQQKPFFDHSHVLLELDAEALRQLL